MKVAIFVEGQTEAILTRTFLERCVSLDDLYIDITTLSKASGSAKPIRSFSANDSAANHYEIFVAPGDGSVLTSLRDRLSGLQFRGFKPIVGLQDMYGRDYSRISGGKLDPSLNEVLRESAADQSKIADPDGGVQFSYAEMEVEAWMLSLVPLFEAIDSSLTSDFIATKLGYDLTSMSPEAVFLQPAAEVAHILQLAGKAYGKHVDEVEMIASFISDEMILKLIESGRAPSFNLFVEAIMPGLT